MSFESFNEFIYNLNTIDSGIYEYYNDIKDKIEALIRIEKINNSRIFINSMLVKIVYEILIEGNSPYTHIDNIYIYRRLLNIRLDDIINKAIQWFNRNKLCRCNIFNICHNSIGHEYDRVVIYKIIKQYILDYGTVFSCKYLFLSYQYYIQEKRVGNIQEINEYELLLEEIEMDPEEFHQKYKHKTPTQNLSNMKYKIMDNDLFLKKQPCCGICQSDIEPQQKYYELTPCGHLFHENSEQCLECATIVFWLKENKLCPICKQEVILE